MIINHVLVALSVETILKQTTLKQMVVQVAEKMEILSTSSVYKRFWNQRKEDLNSDLWVVLKLSTNQQPEEALEFLKTLEDSPKKHALLLSFNDQVRLTPQLTLPHPKLAQEQIVLRCAAEAWGGYEHPVLRQNLNELVKSIISSDLIQFFSQSKNLF